MTDIVLILWLVVLERETYTGVCNMGHTYKTLEESVSMTYIMSVYR